MVIIINRETTICGACGQRVTIEHRQIACRVLMELGYGPTTVGVVGAKEKALEKFRQRRSKQK